MNKHPSTTVHFPTTIETMRRELAEIAQTPDDAPVGLPGRFYTDQQFFDHECETVLRDGWHCVGRTDEVAETGNYFTLSLLGEPLIVVRNGNCIRALSNVCRHRGMRLVEGSGKAKRFVCPYHAWMYGTDGQLLRAARMKNAGFDPKTCKLGEFPCTEHMGFIYVSLNPTPPDLTRELEGLEDLVAPYKPEDYRIVHAATETWNTNWKCLVENFMEGYHLSVVHPDTLHGYTPTGLCSKGASGAGFTSYFANYPADTPSRGKGADGLPPEAQQRSTLFSVFPCQVVSIAASLLVSLSIRPRTAETIEVRWTMSILGDDMNDETIRDRVALWEAVNREDRDKLEAMQPSLDSVHATGGPLAGPEYEGTIRDFILWLHRQFG